MRKSIYWLDELDQTYSDLVGKKCANLGEMTSLGLNVPPGFAVSVDAYERYMKGTGLGKKIADYFAEQGTDLDKNLGKQMEAAKVVQQMFRSTPMPTDCEAPASHYWTARRGLSFGYSLSAGLFVFV